MKKTLCVFICLIMLLSIPSMCVQGALTAPKIKVTVVTATSVRITWNRISCADKYVVYRSLKKNNGYEKLKELTKKSNSYTDKKIKFAKKYYYKVRMYKGKKSKTSSVVSAKTGNCKSFDAVGGANQIRLTWSKQNGVSGYELYRSDEKGKQYKLIYKGSKCEYINKKLPCQTQYYYKVRSYKTVSGTTRASEFSKVKYAITQSHSFTNWSVTVAPNCTTSGVTTRYCQNCAYSESVDIPPTGHDYTADKVIPTCSQIGYTLYNCKKCSDCYKSGFTNKTNHNYMLTYQLQPECTSDGYNEYKCTVCGDLMRTKISSLGHTFDTVTLDDGTTRKICTACGYSE